MKKKWTLIAKLRMCFAAMIGLAFVVGGLALFYNSRLSRELQTAVDVVARKQLLAGQISTAAADMTALERGIAFSAVLTQANKMEALKAQFSESASRASNDLLELKRLDHSEQARENIRELEKAHQGVLAAHSEMMRLLSNQQMDVALQKFESDVAPRLQEIAAAAKRMIEMQSKDLAQVSAETRDSKTTTNAIMISLVALSLLAGLLVLVTLRNATKALRGLTGEINVCATEVSEASQQISHASQSLSVGASRQASSLEETSASSQEMSSMTQTNADNSRRAAEVMSEVDHEVQTANQTLEQMKSSMAEINGSSEKIAKIIKVIDEISFQTNILALNAAVEAARAGDAGMGFAVVADEVRRLAQRCAQAAKDTAALIEESIGTSSEGSRKLNQVSDAVVRITGSANRVKQLVDELNTSSQEQARGVDHIATALTQLEQVTQQNAASAEESASVSSSMAKQSEVMRDVVDRLIDLVGDTRR
jgi:methyl-accepting chemotaxis protein/methyl-accepting chemotaxis protein-1 (serine sensor receptor)